MTFIRLDDGTTLERQTDGSYRPVPTTTDWAYLDGLTDDHIDTMAASDPDHPALDDAFWEQVDTLSGKASIRLEADVVAFFEGSGGADDTKINAVLREYVANQRRTAGS